MKGLVSRYMYLAAFLAATMTAPVGCADKTPPDTTFAQARQKMVETQLMGRDITDTRVLAAMAKVERHRFVPVDERAKAYDDCPLPIGEGQTISQPYIVALMTQLLNLKGNEKVLEIGTGSGYQAAVLAELAREVYTIEIVEPLGWAAEVRLKELGYTNITVRIGDGYLGWPEEAPFDDIIVTCAPDKIPQPLIDQLADGGQMVIPVGTYAQELVLVEKKAGKIIRRSVAPVIFVPMTGEGVRRK
jgi:protein-L-isoaspartate(D-aspartate) O-methyltransferase